MKNSTHNVTTNSSNNLEKKLNGTMGSQQHVQEVEGGRYEWVLKHPNGSEYKGEYTVQNRIKIPNGKGILKLKENGENSELSGLFQDGKMIDGYHREEFSNGDIKERKGTFDVTGELLNGSTVRFYAWRIVPSKAVIQGGEIISAEWETDDGKYFVRENGMETLYTDSSRTKVFAQTKISSQKNAIELQKEQNRFREENQKIIWNLNGIHESLQRQIVMAVKFAQDMGGMYQRTLTDVIVSDVEGLIRELSVAGKSDFTQVDFRTMLMKMDDLKQKVLKNKNEMYVSNEFINILSNASNFYGQYAKK